MRDYGKMKFPPDDFAKLIERRRDKGKQRGNRIDRIQFLSNCTE